MNRANDYICLVVLAIPATIRVVETERPSLPLIFVIIWLVLIPVFITMVVEAFSWLIRGLRKDRKGLRKALEWFIAAAIVAAVWYLPIYSTFKHWEAAYDVGMTKTKLRKQNGKPDIIVTREADDETFPVTDDVDGHAAIEAWVYISDRSRGKEPRTIFIDSKGKVVGTDDYAGWWWKKYKEQDESRK